MGIDASIAAVAIHLRSEMVDSSSDRRVADKKCRKRLNKSLSQAAPDRSRTWRRPSYARRPRRIASSCHGGAVAGLCDGGERIRGRSPRESRRRLRARAVCDAHFREPPCGISAIRARQTGDLDRHGTRMQHAVPVARPFCVGPVVFEPADLRRLRPRHKSACSAGSATQSPRFGVI